MKQKIDELPSLKVTFEFYKYSQYAVQMKKQFSDMCPFPLKLAKCRDIYSASLIMSLVVLETKLWTLPWPKQALKDITSTFKLILRSLCCMFLVIL